MNFDLRAAIENLDQVSIFELANQARPPADYVFNSILPSVNMDTYDVDGGSMTIRATMAGLSGMDSRYNEGGAAEEKAFFGKTGKITISQYLPEKMLRSLQNSLLRLTAQGQSTEKVIQDTGINLINKLIVQPILDREEWLKGMALFTGALDWTMNGIRLQADYGIPAENKLTPRTGNDAYGGTTSKFWVDYHEAQRLLKYRVTACIMHPTLLESIMANAEVNQLEFVSQNAATGVFTFRRLVSRAGNTVLSTDPRDFLSIIAYGAEGEVWDTDAREGTVKVPFCPVGGVIWIGEPILNNVFRIGIGGTEPPLMDTPVSIGYGHVAPTTEGGGLPGRWSRLIVPQNTPWSLQGDGVANFIPVIQGFDRIVIGQSDIV